MKIERNAMWFWWVNVHVFTFVDIFYSFYHSCVLVEPTAAQHQLSAHTGTLEHEEREASNEDWEICHVVLVRKCACFHKCRHNLFVFSLLRSRRTTAAQQQLNAHKDALEHEEREARNENVVFITSHHITSHHITSHHITSHHITSHHITSCYSQTN